MTKIEINVELLLELESKNDWINKIPRDLPELSKREKMIWIDSNGNSLTVGEDFQKAEDMKSYPVKIYRQVRVSEVYDSLI
jgi:hypothetical protein